MNIVAALAALSVTKNQRGKATRQMGRRNERGGKSDPGKEQGRD